jgi:RNA polymerase sigma factor (TIGR02999 family)
MREQVKDLLGAISRGKREAAEQLLPLVYDELRARAGRLMAAERRDHTLQPTALVHEAYLKLLGGDCGFESQLHFFNAAALAMRRILVDHAVRHATLKRGGGRLRVELDELDLSDPAAPDGRGVNWIELDEALRDLEQLSPRQHQIVMLRFFSGRTEAEIADMLRVCTATVRRDWATARVWLYHTMRRRNESRNTSDAAI